MADDVIVYKNICRMFDYRKGRVLNKIDDDSQIASRLKTIGYIDVYGEGRGEPLSVLLFSGKQINKDALNRALGPLIKNQKGGECLIVLSEPPSPYVKKYFDEGVIDAEFPGVSFMYCHKEIFKYENPTLACVPRQRIATREDLAIYEENYIYPNMLPVIYSNDPGAIWIGARHGDVVISQAPSETAGEAEYARICKKSASS